MINYNLLIKNNLKSLQDSIKAAEFEGNDCVYLNTDRYISRFCDNFTPEQDAVFTIEKAEQVFEDYIKENFNAS